MKKHFLTCAMLAMLGISPVLAQSIEKAPLLQMMRQELTYSLDQLSAKPVPAYFMSLRMSDDDVLTITGSFGTGQVHEQHSRTITPMVRIGTMELDNYKFENQGTGTTQRNARGITVPIDNTPLAAYREAIWKETMKRYNYAQRNYQNAVSKSQTQAENEDKSPAFSKAPVSEYYEQELPAWNIDRELWKKKMNKVSKVFRKCRFLESGDASVTFTTQRVYVINSEGTAVVQNRRCLQIALQASIKAKDGMACPLYESFFGFTEDELPSEDELIKVAEDITERLLALREAPVADPFTGPAILSGPASGVFFHEIFGHRLESHRMKKGGETFKKMVGQRVLPEDFSVYCAPTMKYYGKQPLNGYYEYDDEGVKAQKVSNVENGVLKNFLLGRVPIDGFPQSNGHGRASGGNDPVSRQSNLVVETTKPHTEAQLRQMLIDEAKKQGKEYGYYFRSVTGGYTYTESLNSFNVLPLEVYRVYVDGRKDELVRGVSLIGTPLNMFSNIEAAGDTPSTFTGVCGAESGWVPVTATSPLIYVSKVETQRADDQKSIPHPLPMPQYKDLGGADTKPGSKEEENIIFSALQDEMQRTKDSLVIEGQQRPCFIDYRMERARTAWASASLGGLQAATLSPCTNTGSVNSYIGDYNITNKPDLEESGYRMNLAQELDYDILRRCYWEGSESMYKSAIMTNAQKQTSLRQNPLPEEDVDVPELLRMPAKEHVEPSVLTLPIDTAYQKKLVKELSAVFLDYPQLYDTYANLYIQESDVYRVTSDGLKLRVPRCVARLTVGCKAKADDGQELQDTYKVLERSVADFPSLEELKKNVREFAELAVAECNAPGEKEYYVGPIMLEDNAAAGRMLGYIVDEYCTANRSSTRGSSTASAMLGKRIIDTNLSIHQLGGLSEYKGRKLLAYDAVDVDGMVQQKELPLIENGILRNLLTGHNPAVGALQSTGNERFSNGIFSAASAGVVRVSAKKTQPLSKMKGILLSEARKAGLDHAYILRSTYDNMYVLVRVDAKSGEEHIVRSNFPGTPRQDFMHVSAVSSEEFVINTEHKGFSSVIAPRAVILENIEFNFTKPARGEGFQLKRPSLR